MQPHDIQTQKSFFVNDCLFSTCLLNVEIDYALLCVNNCSLNINFQKKYLCIYTIIPFNHISYHHIFDTISLPVHV